MAKYIRIYMSDDEYDLVQKLAKTSKKGLSTFAREMLLSAVKQDIKDTQLLSRLIQKLEKLESLSESQQQTKIISAVLSEFINMQRKHFFILYLMTRNILLNSNIPEATKHALITVFDEKEREMFGATVYEIFGMKK
ncbi:MAG: hypothetical protein NZ942_03370 [Candidatus Aenigmarchaeota archaeon]|nr:hypothetical protein [Candidatus Aenigmarchaeota archaeon]